MLDHGRRGEERADDRALILLAGETGLHFVLKNDATGNKYQIETMPAGVAVIDYDNDGCEDLYFINGASIPSLKKTEPAFWNRLFRNDCRGVFSDVTDKAGVAGEGYSMAAAAADYDNDGRQDVLVTAVGQNRLFRNAGGGRFVDVTDRAGLGGRQGFSTSALWMDYDRDGLLDLVVCNYVRWTPAADVFCSADGRTKAYCTPEAYRGETLAEMKLNESIFTELYFVAYDLYAQLKALVSLLEPLADAGGLTQSWLDALNRAKAALQKAEGE